MWASISNNSLNSVALLLKQCSFKVTGKVLYRLGWRFLFLKKIINMDKKIHFVFSPMKGQFKDEFVTAGGVPLSEVFPFTILTYWYNVSGLFLLDL